MTSRFGKPLDVHSYWKGISRCLNAKLTSLKEYLQHPSTGYVAEVRIREILREHLPSRFAVDTGFVVNSGGRRSRFLDVIIADTLHIPPLCNEGTYRVFAVESVCAVVEVTTSPKQQAVEEGERVDKFESDILKLALVRELGQSRRYLVRYWDEDGDLIQRRKTVRLSPRAFLVSSGDEWENTETYERHLLCSLRNARRKCGSVWVNAALSLNHGLIKFTPYTDFKHEDWITDDALFEFVFFLNHAVQTFCLPNAGLDRKAYRDMPQEESYPGLSGEELTTDYDGEYEEDNGEELTADYDEEDEEEDLSTDYNEEDEQESEEGLSAP